MTPPLPAEGYSDVVLVQEIITLCEHAVSLCESALLACSAACRVTFGLLVTIVPWPLWPRAQSVKSGVVYD